MPCEFVLSTKCPIGHVQPWKCHTNPPKACRRCVKDAADEEQKKKKALELKEKREKEAREHDEQMARLNEQIELQTQALQDERLAQARQIALQQRQRDLASVSQMPRVRFPPPPQPQPQPTALDSPEPEIRPPHAEGGTHGPKPAESPRQAVSSSTKEEIPADSPSKLEWERQKSIEKASNGAIDSLMDMVGLEDVKRQVLTIKAKIDMCQRQNSDVKDERFNISLLGNPGTGEAFSGVHSALAFVANSETAKVKRLSLGFTPKS